MDNKVFAFLHKLTAILRTRLAGAVVLPLFVAAAWAYSRGSFSFLYAALMLTGLVTAEFMDLIAADLVAAGKLKGPRQDPAVDLPGSPFSRTVVDKPLTAGLVLTSLGAAGLSVFIYLLINAGPGILIPFAIALVCAILYAFLPFKGAYLATAFIPMVITGGAFFVFSGTWQPASFLVGLPISLASTGVILTYRLAYGGGRISDTGRGIVLAAYASSLLSIPVLSIFKVYNGWPILAMIPGAVLLAWIARIFIREKSDPLPATLVGVVFHSILSLSLAFSFLA